MRTTWARERVDIPLDPQAETAPVSVQTDRTLHLQQQHDELNSRYTALLQAYGAYPEQLSRWLTGNT